MRVISGDARGTKLETLDGENTRPTLDRVKEALFSIIQNYIYEAEVLDLFSGSGALAIESISRGAKNAIVSDNNRKAVQIIKHNIQKTHYETKIDVINKDYKKTLEEIKQRKFDIVFLDPPYKSNYGANATKIILENKMLKKDGIIVFETDEAVEEFIENTKEIAKVIDLRKYGRVKLIFLGRKE